MPHCWVDIAISGAAPCDVQTEKFRRPYLEIHQRCLISRLLARQSGLENALRDCEAVPILAFLWRAYLQSGFERGPWRMQCDHSLRIGQLLITPAPISAGLA